ncbi:RidA family protein [Roseiterribacter gracilis]|uniref:Uncharacterized protein n=1 Tax=Roseiterribacter gracilis TaxID=2812848 RepID=A0A8S8XJQ8_9PROT|nr:hypothetical protein TMPK1_32370 [Rhodospirillales bacterium TMPK1]
MRLALCFVAAALAATTADISANAADVTRVQGESPIASVVTVPAGVDTIYLSGTVPPVVDQNAPKGTVASFGDTETQTVNVLKRIEETLKGQKLTMSDIIAMRVYLVGDPAKDNKMDFAGMMKGYVQFFGTKEQPNKPVRTTVQVAALAASGMLVEIEVVAARGK